MICNGPQLAGNIPRTYTTYSPCQLDDYMLQYLYTTYYPGTRLPLHWLLFHGNRKPALARSLRIEQLAPWNLGSDDLFLGEIFGDLFCFESKDFLPFFGGEHIWILGLFWYFSYNEHAEYFYLKLAFWLGLPVCPILVFQPGLHLL